MTEEQKTTDNTAVTEAPNAEAEALNAEDSKPRGVRPRKPRRGGEQREPKEFEESILQIDRVTRVTRGGRQLRFRISVIIGDKKGRVGFGIGKSGEVLVGIQKAVADAKKNLINVPTFNETIPHPVHASYKASNVFLLPAPEGTGVIAGGAIRKILELAGVQNVLSKMHGSRNKINTARATFRALEQLATKAPHTKNVKEEAKEAPAKKEEKASKEAPAKKPAAKKVAPKKK